MYGGELAHFVSELQTQDSSVTASAATTNAPSPAAVLMPKGTSRRGTEFLALTSRSGWT